MAGFARVSGETSIVQEIPLTAGWNLISLQVGDGLTPAEFQAALGSDADKLRAIWEFEPEASANNPAPWEWRFFRPDTVDLNRLTTVAPGKGYWVDVSQTCVAVISGVPWEGTVEVRSGWNLLGFPGAHRGDDESQELSSAFGAAFDRITQVWAYDASAQRFIGYDLTSIPILRELTTLELGNGYWVHALEAVTLMPDPLVALPQDADASPLQDEEPFQAVDFPGLANAAVYLGTDIRKPGDEDTEFDLNGNGIIDSPFTQDTLRFDIGVDRKILSITNSDEGSGLFNWCIQESVPWLEVDNLQGTVSSETDFVTIAVDRANLLPGRKEGVFTLKVGNETRSITVQLEVSTAAGDWKGFAAAKTVNGKDIPLGKIDLVLNLSMNTDNVSETSFRAVLNRDRSLLFPRDVFMNGVFFANNEFTLTTNFEMEAGDRNAPPFDVFKHESGNPLDRQGSLDSSTARGDKDYDGDGKLDVANPFPFAVTREVTLVGKRRAPNRMEGEFVESIGGLLPNNEVIFIEGTFELDRETLEPTKRSVFNERAIANLPIGGSAGEPFRESTITVDEAVSIQGLEVLADVSFNLPDTLKVKLTGPDGRTLILHDEEATLANRFVLADYNGMAGLGNWIFRIEWDPASGERGFFNNWSLNLEGIATYDVTGTVVDDATAPLSGAQVILSGSNVIVQTTTDGSGQFQFTGLTENSYTATVSAPGFQSRVLPFFLRDENLDLGTVPGIGTELNQIQLAPINVGEASFAAAPYLGSAPLGVRLSASIPRVVYDNNVGANAVITWDYGDGTSVGPFPYGPPDFGDLIISGTHSYTIPGHHLPSVVLVGDNGTLQLDATVDVYPSQADPSGPLKQVNQYAFIGSLAAPISNPPEPDGDPVEVAGNVVYQAGKRDTAAFDVDRGSPGFLPNQEDTDFFTQEGTPFHAVSPETANGTYDVYQQPEVNGEVVPDRFRMVVSMGGYVFREAPSRVTSFVLQASRLEGD